MKILFVHKSMNMGGIEKSLLNLTEELVKDHNIKILLLNDTFGKELFNEKIEFIKSKKIFRLLNPKKNYTKSQKSFLGFAKQFLTIFKLRPLLEQTAAKIKVCDESFSIAIAFHGQDYITCNQVANKINADKKFVFLHCDASQVKLSKKLLKLYNKFDKIICVSKSCAEDFKELFSNLSDKVDYLYNLCDENEVIQKAREKDIAYSSDCLNIISVSRLSEEKGYLRSLPIFKKLKDEGYKFVWHIIGDGGQREEIENYIKNNNMEEYIKLYGNQVNPYPYVKSSDLFYLGSFHESFGISMIEALLLKIPVITTNTISSKEIIQDNGIVCENNEKDIEETLRKVLSDNKLIKQYKDKLQNYSFDKKSIINKFNSL